MEKIPIEWFQMLKQWIQTPIIEEVLTDIIILKAGEAIVENEKVLATMLQGVNIRLPGYNLFCF